LQKVKRDGPISSSDVDAKHSVFSNWGTEATFGRVALETLWKMGRLVIVRRENGRKWYDIPGKFHKSLSIEPTHYTLTKEHIKRRLQAVGLLPLSGSGGGWQGLGPVSIIKSLIKEVVKDDEFSEITIDNCKRVYVIQKGDLDILKKSTSQITDKEVSFIAPLDNLMWDREMIHELFNFYYRWEVYTPLAKRKYGYYVLPILYGDRFIGRIEPVLTKDRNLLIKGFWQEDNALWDTTTWQAFNEALERFKLYLNAEKISNSPTSQ
jgi:uncharacterized protein YcaQ